MHIEGLRRAEPMRVPDLVHDRLSTHDLAGVRHQQVEQIELLRRELDRLPSFVSVREAGSSRRAPTSSGPFRAVPRPRRMMARIRAVSSPARTASRLVVGPQLEPEDAVDLLAPGGEHHDRDVRSSSDPRCEVPSVSVRQHHVQEDRGPSGSRRRPRGTRERGRDLGFESVSSDAPAKGSEMSPRPRPGGSGSS